MSKKSGSNEVKREWPIDELLAKIEEKYLNGAQFISCKEIEKIALGIATGLDKEELVFLFSGYHLGMLEERLIKIYLKNRTGKGEEKKARSIFMQSVIPEFRGIFFPAIQKRFSLDEAKNKLKIDPDFKSIPRRVIVDIRRRILAATDEGDLG